MISNPYLPSPERADAWSEGFIKGLMDSYSSEPSEALEEDALEAFNDGVAAGIDAQVDLARRHLAALARPPARDELRLRVRPVHQVPGRVELARDQDLGVGRQRQRRGPATGHRHLLAPSS